MSKQTTSKPYRVVLPVFTLTSTCEPEEPGALRRELNPDSEAPYVYYYKAVDSKEQRYSYNLFPVVLSGDGSPWAEANLYILSRLESEARPKVSTYVGIAGDLGAFKAFLEDENIDYTDFPAKKLYRPTYRYSGYLKQRARAGEIAVSTASRCMIAAVSFYRWLISEGYLIPENQPWVEGDRYIQFRDSKGFNQTKVVKTTNISIKVPKQKDPYAGEIDDGGKLRPLTYEEQEKLLGVLAELDNTEIVLLHLIALFTGARIQTTCTLRVKHVQMNLSDDEEEVAIPVGPGTGVDTKYDKQMTLFFPRWLYEKLWTYSQSERAQKRRKLAGRDDMNQFLFLTDRGTPFYQSNDDRFKFNPELKIKHEKLGQAIRVYMRETIIPKVQTALGKDFYYRFHDMRASYGMNLTDHMLSLVQAGKVTLHEAREFVKVRMGHRSAATTDLYLNYRSNSELVRHAQKGYEAYLKRLASKAMAFTI